MSKTVQHKGGSTVQNDSYTGAPREITVDTTKNTLRVHDGVTAGGTELARMADLVVANGILPAGGNPGEYLVKNSAADYDLVYTDRAHASVLKGYAKNVGAATLPKGTPVYATGGVSGFSINVDAADAEFVYRMPAIGVLGEDLAPAAEGELIVLGEIQGVDTSTFNEGDLVYVAVGGGYTNVAPTAPDVQVQFLGIVTKSHATAGGCLITGTGVPEHFRINSATLKYEVWDGAHWQQIVSKSVLSELADVTVTTPEPGQVLSFNGTAWVNSDVADSTYSHNNLLDRTLADQHPISAITNLTVELDGKVSAAGDSMTGSLSLPKTKGDGLLIDDGYSWMDIIGAISPKQMGTTAAQFLPFIDKAPSWAHYAGSKGQMVYHIPHEYAPGTNIFLHVHWGHNGTAITGSLIIKCWISIARRTYPVTSFSAPIETQIAITGINLTDYPQYSHSVNEIQISTLGGAVNMLDTNDIETDGMIIIQYEIDTIPSIDGSAVANVPYIQTFDLHVQSTNVGTKNKDPNFWA